MDKTLQKNNVYTIEDFNIPDYDRMHYPSADIPEYFINFWVSGYKELLDIPTYRSHVVDSKTTKDNTFFLYNDEDTRRS